MAGEHTYPNLFNELLFPRIFKSFRMAIQPGKLMMALAGLAVIAGLGWVMNYTGDVAVTRDGRGLVQTELEVYLTDPTVDKTDVEGFRSRTEATTGLVTVLWATGCDRFHRGLVGVLSLDVGKVLYCIRDMAASIVWAFNYHPTHAIILFGVTLASMAVAGGTICRIAALQFALHEKPSLRDCYRYSLRKFSSYLAAPLAPMGIMLVLGGFIAIFGLLGNIPYAGEMIVGVGTAVSLGIGVLITVVVIGLVAGFGLMFPAVAYDGSDCFDSISRSFSYIYGRPWRMGFYTLLAALYGGICYLFVRLFALILLTATRFFLEVGIWADSSSGQASKLEAIWPAPGYMNLMGGRGITSLTWSETVGTIAIQIWVLVVSGLVAAYVISFFFTSQTIIYAILRKHTDRTAIEDIYTPGDEPGSELFDWDSDTGETSENAKAGDKS